MDKKIIYTYTFERLNEFKLKKSVTDEIITPIYIINEENSSKIDNNKNYFVDLTNFYKSNTELNNTILEKIMYYVFSTKNMHVILNVNSKNRFSQDFAASFDDFKPIQTIYEANNEDNYDFINIDSEGLRRIETALSDDLIGHEAFKQDFLNKLKYFKTLNKLGEMKIFSILLCGNSGVGKTELARLIHKTMFKDSKRIKINLGNYKTQGALNSLIGSPIGFIGSERGGELSNKIQNSDSKIILIDEFEKADTDIFNFFYELLEDGKFTDLVGNEYDLNGYIIIFTTNLSFDNYKKVLPLPLLSRITLKSFFENPNNKEKQIFIEKRINNLIENCKANKLETKITAEDIKNKLDYNIINKVSDFRIIKRLIIDALIKTLEEIKNNK